MRIPLLLQKLTELSAHPEQRSAIDVDLMLDYTRVLYADLLEWRDKSVFMPRPATLMPVDEPTLAEMADAMNSEHAEGRKHPDEQREAPYVTPATTNTEQSTAAGPAPADPAKDIRSLIGINDKYQIMSALFGNDKAAYEDALHHINISGSEAEAIRWLQERLWVTEEQEDAAQSFYDLVRRFKGKAKQNSA